MEGRTRGYGQPDVSTLTEDIWASFRDLPVAVQLWVGLWLGPVNMATVFFTGEENGVLICALAILGMALNMPIMIQQRGMSPLMAAPHIAFWTPMVVIAALTLFSDIGSSYRIFLWILIATDVVSLVFDVKDLHEWRTQRSTG